MFNIGDTVVYGSQGVCKIDCVETKQIGKQSADYYVLKPLFNDSTSLFVPVNNDKLTSKIRDVLTKAQLDDFVKKIPDIELLTYADENQKRELYKLKLSESIESLAAIIKTIRHEKDFRKQNNKKLNIGDEQTLRKAEQLFYNEIAFVLSVEPEKVKDIINF